MTSHTEPDGPAHMAAVKCQPLGYTQVVAKGALEAGPALGPGCLGDNETVLQRKDNTQPKAGIFFSF